MDYQQKGSENKGQDGAKKEEAKVTWKCPTQSNVITSPFGPRNVKGGSNPHLGIDLRAQAGASYYAAADGNVTRAGGGDYNTIVIDHGGGIQTRYLHASAVATKLGKVKAGDRLAAAGGKGPKGVNHYAYHLHFDVIKNGTRIDPEAFLQSQGVSLVRKGGKGDVENGTTGGKAEKTNNNAPKGSGSTAKTDPALNKEGHPIYYPKGVQDTNERINWNKARNYTTAYIKALQKLIETNDDGGFGTNTVNAIRHYQEKNNLPSKDGKWGKECADHSGLERQYNGGSSNTSSNTSSGGGASTGNSGTVSSGGHKNAPPLYQKQRNFSQPYVKKAHYNDMKEKMGDTPYKDWKVNDPKISGIYSKAVSENGDTSTIASSGCGITAYANLRGISPTESAQKSMEGGYRLYNAGTDPGFFISNGGKKESGWTDAFRAIDQGKYVIYSRYGHYLLLYGYDDKHLYISDSGRNGQEKVSLRSDNQKKHDGYWYHGYSFDK